MNNKMTVSKYLESLAIGGQRYFLTKDVCATLSMKQSVLSVSISRLALNGKVKMIRRGFGIYTGLTNGVLHPSFFIDAMMTFMNARYYVGLLNAASYFGASHQAVMTYTVVVDRVMKPILLDGLTIEFVTKNDFGDDGIDKVAGEGGYFNLSRPELTVIDLIRFPKKSGHLNNIATVYEDLTERLDMKKFSAVCLSSRTPTSALQRIGFIFETILDRSDIAKIIYQVFIRRTASRIRLSTYSGDKKEPAVSESFNKKWKLYVNTVVEPD